MSKSCVHIYTGEGKGKTTAAAGLAARAAGQGLRVGFFQFLKSGKLGISGEVISLSKLGVLAVSPPCDGFVWQMDEEALAACKAQQKATFERAVKLAPELDLLVLDEAVCALDAGMLDAENVRAFLQNRPEGLEVVLTGRGDITALCDVCDYITEMRPLAHPCEKGVGARRGIEY